MHQIPLHKSKKNLRLATPTVQNCVCSKLLFWLKSNIEEPLTNQILEKKVNEPLKTIFYPPHYASLLSKANFKIDHAHFWNMCLLKYIIFLENQHFRIFQHSNICSESRWVNKNHFLSYTLCISVKVSIFQDRPHPLFKTVPAQMHYFPWKSTFSNFSALKYSQWK